MNTKAKHTLADEFGLNPLGFSTFIEKDDKAIRRQRQEKQNRLREASKSLNLQGKKK